MFNKRKEESVFFKLEGPRIFLFIFKIFMAVALGLIPCAILGFFRSWFKARPYTECLQYFMEKWLGLFID